MTVIRNYQYFQEGEIEQHKRKLPDVDAKKFNESAITFRGLIKDASKVLDRLADSMEFAHDIMSAAQISDTLKVEKLIESTGIKSKVEPKYNPDGLTMIFHDEVENTDCCKLQMTLRW